MSSEIGLGEVIAGQCPSGLGLEATVNARLTSREYSHTIKDIFGRYVAGPTLDAALVSLPKENLSVAHTKLDFDTSISRAIQFSETEAYAEIASSVADAFIADVKSSSDNLSLRELFGGTCFKTESTLSDDCLRRSFGSLIPYFYRRPATAAEVERLLTIQRDALNADRYEGIAMVLQYLMQSPHFLYKVEGPGEGGVDVYALNDYEIAVRLSYGIIGGPPPPWLFTAATRGELLDEDKRLQLIERLFALPEAQRASQDFYDQWLRVNQVPNLAEAATLPESFNSRIIRETAINEVRAYTRHITWDLGGTYADLMTSPLIIPATPELARVYGVSQSTTPVVGPAERKGLLTRAGMLMVKSDGRSGPILRGSRLRSDLLCDDLTAPPDNVFSNLGKFNPLDSTRKQTEDITRAPACMSCHSQVNQLGFAFERFSGLGFYRTTEKVSTDTETKEHAIQPAGSSYIDRKLVTFGDSGELMERITNSDQGSACMAKRYFQFASGQAKLSAAGCESKTLIAAFAKNGRIVDMMKSYYTRPEILYRKPGAP